MTIFNTLPKGFWVSKNCLKIFYKPQKLASAYYYVLTILLSSYTGETHVTSTPGFNPLGVKVTPHHRYNSVHPTHWRQPGHQICYQMCDNCSISHKVIHVEGSAQREMLVHVAGLWMTRKGAALRKMMKTYSQVWSGTRRYSSRWVLTWLFNVTSVPHNSTKCTQTLICS